MGRKRQKMAHAMLTVDDDIQHLDLDEFQCRKRQKMEHAEKKAEPGADSKDAF